MKGNILDPVDYFFFDGLHMSLPKYTTKRNHWNSLQSKEPISSATGRAFENFYENNPLIPTHYLREMLRLILKENSFQFNGKLYLQIQGTG